MHDPKVLFLDEPLNGLDTNAIQIFKEMLKKMAKNGKTIFYSSHLLDVIEKVCDKLIIINQGKIIASGSIEDILKKADVSQLNEAFIKLTGIETPSEKIDKFLNRLR
jgi:ABC-2 type transport system ATP-binding protein